LLKVVLNTIDPNQKSILEQLGIWPPQRGMLLVWIIYSSSTRKKETTIE
jgi:hypothetical protein